MLLKESMLEEAVSYELRALSVELNYVVEFLSL